MFFQVVDLGRQTRQIICCNSVSMFLIEGDEKAMLIDTGAGVGDLKALVESMTKKPVIVVNTHGHLDHTGGNMQFEETWMDFEDLELDKMMNTFEARKNWAETRVGTFMPEMKDAAVAAVQPQGTMNYRELKEGMVFELGNRSIEVIKTPGHSVGSVALLDASRKQMFTGDMVNFQTLVYNGFSAPREVYVQSLQKMKSRSNEYDRILRGHDIPCGTTEDMDTLIGIVEDIVSGKDEGHFEEVGIRKGWVVRRGPFSVWYEGPVGHEMSMEEIFRK